LSLLIQWRPIFTPVTTARLCLSGGLGNRTHIALFKNAQCGMQWWKVCHHRKTVEKRSPVSVAHYALIK
jgi:hypothetical protein